MPRPPGMTSGARGASTRPFRAELPVSGRQVLMAARYGLVARHRAAPQRAVLRLAFRIREETFDQMLCYLPVENRKPWIDVDQGVGRGKSFPGCGGVAVAIDDPGLLGQKIAVQRKIFFVGDSLT